MSLSAVTLLATEKINHWVIGGVALFLLVAAMVALIAFGAGREHS